MRSKGGNILMRASFSTIVTNNTMQCNGVLQKCDTSAIELTQKSNSKQDRHYFKKSQTATDYFHQNQKVLLKAVLLGASISLLRAFQ